MSTSRKADREWQRHKFWQQHIDAWQRSGKSISTYCAEQALSESSFRAGKRALESRDEAPPTTDAVPIRWVPVHIVPTSNAAPLELVLTDGRVIRVPSGFDPQALRRLLTALEEDKEVSSC
jgi:hypothetical protein